MNGCQENKITHFCRKISIFGFFAQHEFVKTSNIHPEIFCLSKSATWKVFAFSASDSITTVFVEQPLALPGSSKYSQSPQTLSEPK